MADVIVHVGADISQFTAEMNSMKTQYSEVQKEIESNKVDVPGSEASTQDSFNYMLNTINKAQYMLSTVQSVGSMLPRNIQQAMSSLTTGLEQSLGNLTNYIGKAGKTMEASFDMKGFNNQIRFSTASLSSYVADLNKVINLANSMDTKTKDIVGKNYKQISSLVDPTLSSMFTKHHRELRDNEIVSELLHGGEEYSYVRKALSKMGLENEQQQKNAIEFAIRNSQQRMHRQDVQREIFASGIEHAKKGVFATDVVKPTYKAAYVSGGRYLGEEKTPRIKGGSDRFDQLAFYEGIKKEILNGNTVAYKAAKNAKLISEEGGKYRFLLNDVINDTMLNQFAGHVIAERKHAAEGSPQYRRNLLNPEDAYRLVEKENRRIAESDRLIDLDERRSANPYISTRYNKKMPKNLVYEDAKESYHVSPALSIPELINIPRMSVRNENGKTQLMTKRLENGSVVYNPNINYDWQKKGIRETPFDEFVTMGRNPILDRLIKLHKNDEGTVFEDRTFGYGFDKNDRARRGAPLIISTSVDDLRDKDKFGNIKFIETQLENEKSGSQKAYFPNNGAELIDKINKGLVKPVVQDEKGNEIEYRMFAGHTTGSGSMIFMRDKDYRELERQDKERGLTSMLRYFNETDENGNLINPETGYAFRRNSNDRKTEAELGAYRRYFDARNKGLSHSLPIEEVGGKTPLAALVNFGAYYKATNTPDNQRFDGGGFIDPTIYSKDFQARMGPAKFLAQRLNWRNFLSDAGFTYKDANGKEHFYMPGMSASADDYKLYRRMIQAGTGDTDIRPEFGGNKTFAQWRDERFVDIMDPKYGVLLSDTTLKGSPLKSGLMTAELFDELAEIQKKKNPNSAFLRNRILKSESEYAKDENGKTVEHKDMIKLTPAQQTELMKMYADPEYGFGLRMMKDTENYAGTKNFWSPAYMSSVRMTPEMMARSAKNYADAFAEMSTPEGIIKRMFSGNDYDSRRVRQDPSLIFSDANLKYRIAAEKEDLQMKQLLGYGYFPGMSQMMVAGVNPYSLFNPIGRDITGHEALGAAAKLQTGKHGVIASTVENNGIVNWTRSPYAPGANFFARSLRSDALKRYGLTSDSALFNISDFYELNTGDFDGDFVWAQKALYSDKEFQRLTEERNKGVLEIAERALQEKDLEKRIAEKKKAEPDFDPSSYAEALNNSQESASGPTGLGYKVAQAFRMGLFTADEVARMDAYGNDTYQVGIDMAKKVDAKVRAATPDIQEAIRTRKPFERLTKSLVDEYENERYGATDIFDYGIPTYIDPIGTAMLAAAKTGRDADVTYGKKFAEMMRKNIEARYNTPGTLSVEKNLANWYSNLVTSKATGKFQITSTETLQEGQNLLEQLDAEANRLEQEKGQDDETVKRLRALYRHADSAIKTERTVGYTEDNLESIRDYNRSMNWQDLSRKYGFRTELDARVADIEYEAARDKRRETLEQAHETQLDEALEAASGRVQNTPEAKRAIMDRILAAELYTGFNWSNAKYFVGDEKDFLKDFGGTAEYVSVSQDPTKNGKTSAYKGRALLPEFLREEKDSQEQVARRILTGETKPNAKLEAHALVGTAAHKFMEEYGKARTVQNGDRATAEDVAEAAFRDYLLGRRNEETGLRELTEEQRAEQARANVSFTEHPSGNITVNSSDDSIRKAIQAKLDRANLTNREESTLFNVARGYYENALVGGGGYHMVMSEGNSYEWNPQNNRSVLSQINNGHAGIYIVPQRDGKNVIDFQRTRVNSKGEKELVDAGTYFTPDMVKQSKDGSIVISDWKSGVGGQKDALFQTAYYAHLLEEKGKEYWVGSESPELEQFKKYVNYDKATGKFTSNIKALEAINLFSENPEETILRGSYSMELGDAVAKWVEGGYKNLSTEAKLGFIRTLNDDVKVNFLRSAMGERPTLAPGSNESEYRHDDVPIEELEKRFAHINEIYNGGTGIRDAEGHYIDQDKAFLVHKYSEDEKKLADIRAFQSKQYRRLNNMEFDSSDEYTRNINAIGELFTNDDYDTLMKYYRAGDYTAPDVDQMKSHFSAQQHEASNQLKNILNLRSQYHKQMFDSMDTDYADIAYGKGDIFSKLRYINRKHQQDLSVVNEERKADKYYDENVLGGFQTDMSAFYTEPAVEKRKDETDEAFEIRRRQAIEKARQDAQAQADIRKRQKDWYDSEVVLANTSFQNANDLIRQQILAERETEANPLIGMLRGETFDESIYNLNKRAKNYKDLAGQKNQYGEYVYDNEMKELFKEENERFIRQAEMLKGIQEENPFLSNLSNARKEYSKALVTSRMNGTPINPKVLENNAMLGFALDYLQANTGTTANELTEALNRYQEIYEKTEEEKMGFRSKPKKKNSSAMREYARAKLEQANQEYDEAVTRSEMLPEDDTAEETKAQIRESLEAARQKKTHAEDLVAQAERQNQIEQYQSENSSIRNAALLENRGLSTNERRTIAANNAMIERERFINDQLALNENFDADAYRKQHSKEAYETAYDQKMTQQSKMMKQQLDLADMMNAQREDQSLRQIDYAQQDFNYQRGQRMAYSMFARAYQPYRQRRVQLQRQIESLEGDNGQIAIAESKRDMAYNTLMANEELKPLLEGKTKQEQLEFLKTYQPKSEGAAKAISGYKNAESEVNRLNSVLNESKSALQSTGGVGAAAFDTITQSVSRLASRLGRQMFQKALTEAKRFVKEFSATMTEIQMITLKTDEQISTLGSSLIDTAKNLKVSVSEVSKSAATLYRQGLSDEEVQDRLEVVSKFSKVSGAKVEDATKLITVAMNTGLVTNATEAADIVTALGDNAATNAQQIEKGIEKAGAAAAADGTTFAELAAMLTAITSTTQIGGNVAGRTLNTIFGRMNKIGTNELIYDENGNAVSGSAVSQLLAAQGIRTYDEQGNKRSSYSVLYDLSQKWDTLADAEQQQLANAIAGTRQYSNFAAIMQGMSEGKVDEYMELAGNASGITDKKYGIYADSLQASLTNLRNTFDELINDLADSGALSGFIDNITQMIQGVNNLTSSIGGLNNVLPVMVALFGALTGLKIGAAFGPLGAIIGALAGGVGGLTLQGVLMQAGQSNENVKETYQNALSTATESRTSKETSISRLSELAGKDKLTSAEKQEYVKLATQLSSFAGLQSDVLDLATSAVDATGAVSDLANETANLSDSAKDAAKQITDAAEAQIKQNDVKNAYNMIGIGASNIAKEADTAVGDYYKGEGKITAFENKLSKYAEDHGIKDFSLTPEKINEVIGKVAGHYIMNFDNESNELIDYITGYMKEMADSNADIGAEYRGKSKSYWRDKVIGVGGAKDVFGSYWLSIPGVGAQKIDEGFLGDFVSAGKENQQWATETGASSQKKQLTASVESFLKDIGIEDKYISSIAKTITSGYYNDSRVKAYQTENGGVLPSVQSMQGVLEEQIKQATGYTQNQEYSPDRYKESYVAAAKKGGWIEDEAYKLEKLNLASDADYFLDADGNPISNEEAAKLVKDYNEKIAIGTKGTRILDSEVANGQELGRYFAADVGSVAGARALAESQKRFYYTNDEGKRVYTDREGNFLTSQEAADAEAEYYRNNVAQWQGSFFDRQNWRTVRAEGTKAEVEQQLEDARKLLEQTAYGVNFGGERQVQRFASAEEAQAYADELTTKDSLRYSRQMAAAQAAQRRNTEYHYTDIYGDEHTGIGFKGQQKLETLRQQEQASPWVIRDADGKILATFDTEEKAREALNTEARYKDYYDNGPGGLGFLGRGQVGYEEALKHKAYYDNGKYLGYDEEGAAAAEERGRSWAVTDRLGEEHYYTSFSEANDKYNEWYNELQEELEHRAALLSQFTGSEYTEEGARTAVFDEMKTDFENLGDGIKQHKANIEIKPIEIQESIFATIDNIEDTIGEVEDVVPKLADIDTAQIATVFSQLPSKTQAAIKKAVETGEVTLDVLDDITQEMTEALKNPIQKAVYNRFNGSAASGYSAWSTDSKNATGLLVDKVIRQINQTGIDYTKPENLQALVNAVNFSDIKDWETLTTTLPEFGRLASQVKLDKAGQIVSSTANTNIGMELIDMLYKSSRDYGEMYYTNEQKAGFAVSAIDKYMRGNAVSYEDALQQISANYEKEVNEPWNKQFNEYVATLPANMPQNLRETNIANWKKQNPKKLAEDYEKEQLKNYNYIDTLESTYLENVLGKDMAAYVKNRGERLTAQELDYINTKIEGARYGRTSLTTSERMKGLSYLRGLSAEEYRQYISTPIGQEAASKYTQGLSNFEDYNALMQRQNELTDEEAKRLQTYDLQLDELQKSAKIEIEVENIKALEEAGEIAEGTATAFEKLAKGGKDAADAMNTLTSEAFSSGQQRAKLYNGNEQEQAEAVMAYLGLSSEQFYANGGANVASYVAAAQSYEQLTRNPDAAMWNKLIWQHGITSDQRQERINLARMAGFSYDEENGEVYYNGELPDISRKKTLYTDKELAAAQAALLSGELTQYSNPDLYEAAKSAAGKRTQKVLEDMNAGEPISSEDWAAAERETLLTNVQALEAEGEVVKGVTSLVEGLTSPIEETYEQAKRDLITQAVSQQAEQTVFARMQGLKTPEDWAVYGTQYAETLGGMLNWTDAEKKYYSKEENFSELEAIMQKRGEKLNDLLKDAITSMFDFADSDLDLDESSLGQLKEYLDMLSEHGDEAAAGLSALLDVLAKIAGLDLNTGATTPENLTSADIFSNAYLTDKTTREQLARMATTLQAGVGYDEGVNSLIGEDEGMFASMEALKEFLSKNEEIDKIFGEASSTGTFTPELINKITQASALSLTNQDQNYALQYEKWKGLQNAQGGIDIGELQNLGTNDKDFAEWAKQFSGLADALNDVQGSADGSGKAIKTLNTEMYAGLLRSLRPWGDATDEIVDTMVNVNSSTTKAANVMKNFNTQLNNVAKNQYYKQAFEGGKRDSKTLSAVKEMTGLQNVKDEEIKSGALDGIILESLQQIENADIEGLENTATGIMQSLAENLSQYLDGQVISIPGGPTVDVSGGSWSVSMEEIQSGVLGAMTREQEQLIASLQAMGITAHYEVDDNGKTVTGKVVIDSVKGAGSHGGGGGGGGGGGKSEADKLLEEQKHRVSEIQHLIKMQQIAESHYDRTNNQGAYFGSLENEIALQHRLGDEYQRNIAEMQAQLAQVAEGSDDWKKLTEAIWQAEEAYAAIQDEIAAIQKKKLVYIEKQQSYADSKTNYSQSILQSYAQRYLDTDRFKDYENAIKNEVDVVHQIIRENESQVAELEGSLHLFEEDSDEFRQAVQDIYNIKLDTAQKENEAVELQLELDRQRLAQIEKVLHYNTAPAQHSVNMADTYSGYYEKAGYLREAQNMTAKNRDQYQKQIEETTKAMDEAIARMNAMETGSVVWYEARDAVFQYEESLAQLNVSMLETDDILQELEMRVIETDFTDATRPLEHSLKLLSDVKAEAQDTGDYKTYTESIEKTLAIQAQYLDAQREAIRKQREFIAENDLTPEMRRQAEEQLNQYEENYSNTIREINNEKRELQKAQVDELTEKFDRRKSNYEHNLKLIQYHETVYSNNKEWTNVNNMLEQEIELKRQERIELEQENLVWEKQLDELGDNEKEYAAVTEKIKKNEEQIQSLTVEIDKNTKSIEENRKKILQASSSVKDGLRQRIDEIIKYDRETLASTVSMENTILETIKNKYREEWNLKKKGLEEDKKILSEQKQLINERLNARKKAADEAEKYEELAELRSQLAIIRADPSRTKDAKELERKIRDLEKDTAMSTAEQEAEANQKSLDDQITAIDDFVRVNEENLSELLSDANNFAGRVGEILTSSYEEVVMWLQENNKEYRNSLADAQQQMINSWEDTWKRMHEITDNYWDRIYTLMFSEESYVNYMMETERKLNPKKSEEYFELKEQAYHEQYRDMVNSTKNDPSTAEIHDHDIPEVSAKVSELIDIEGEILGTLKAAPVFKAWHMFEQPYSDKSNGEEIDYKAHDYTGWGLVVPVYVEATGEYHESSGDGGGSGGSTGGGGGNYEIYQKADGYYAYRQSSTGTLTKSDAATVTAAKNTLVDTSNAIDSFANSLTKMNFNGSTLPSSNTSAVTLPRNAKGGLVDYTGLAWVDGSFSEPEAFLDAYDTESIRMMLDEFNYIRKMPTMPHLDAIPANSNTVSIGDIHVNLYEAKLNSDADYDEVAKKVGKAFSKELKNNGINLANYAW